MRNEITKYIENLREDFSSILLGGYLSILLLSFTIFISGPINMVLTNATEFPFTYSDLLPYIVPIAAYVFLLLSAVLTLLPLKRSSRCKVVSLLFAIAFLLWFQGNIVVWNYGPLDGTDIDWSKTVHYGIIDGLIWIVFIVVVVYKSEKVSRFAKWISTGLIVLQLISIIALSTKQVRLKPSCDGCLPTEEHMFTVSSKRNIFVFVLDHYRSDVFQDIVANKVHYRKVFDGFTYFRNALGGYPGTIASIPYILTGMQYYNSMPFSDFLEKAYFSETSILKKLRNLEYVVDIHTWAWNTMHWDSRIVSNYHPPGKPIKIVGNNIPFLLDLALFRHSPHFIKKYVYNDHRWFLSTPPPVGDSEKKGDAVKLLFQADGKFHRDFEFTKRAVAEIEIGTDQPVFKYYHLAGVHPPLRMNANLKYQILKTDSTSSSKKSFKIAGKASIKMMNMIFQALKDRGVYDNSMIIVVADHGFGSRGNLQYPKDLPEPLKKTSNPIGSGIPIILIKPFNSINQLKISDAPVTLGDIPATVFAALDVSGNKGGLPMFEVKNNEVRKRRFFNYKWIIGHDWIYLPELSEYRISGHSWFDKSWRKTGRKFSPGKNSK